MAFLNNYFLQLNATANTLCRVLRWYHSNRSLRAWGVLLSHYRRRALGRPMPISIVLAPTYRCQCRCVHCAANPMQNDEHDELNTWQIKSVIDQAKQLGVIQVCFTGGEPLLREDIVELVRYAHDAGLITRIMTNGLLLARERVIKLKEAGLTQCSVSIDDADPDTHDRLRGLPGTYKKALDGIKTLQEFNILCQILTVACKRNITAGLEKIIALGRQLGLMCVYIIFPVATGRWDGAFEQLLSEEEKARVRELEDLTFVRLEIPAPLSMCCVVAKSALFVSPRGDVTPCPYVPYVIGNIEDHTLKDLWERYCAALSPECRGECPMNDVRHREALKKHVDSVARCLR